jgi:hypothetical protein
MLRKIFVLVGLLLASVSAPAAVIEYKGYSRDSSSNIVTGGGLEWLKWDVTKGMSIQSALAAYSADGWTLASNSHMAGLFNDFQFGKNDWSDLESESQFSGFVSVNSATNVATSFFQVFGQMSTISDNGHVCSYFINKECNYPGYLYRSTAALFGNDADGDFQYNQAFVMDGLLYAGADENFAYRVGAYLDPDYQVPYLGYEDIGVALVRAVQPIPVSLPGSFSIIVIGLVGLAYCRRKDATAQLCGKAV